jgi:hypothetical protein
MAHDGDRVDSGVIDGPESAGRLVCTTRRHGNFPHMRRDVLRAAIDDGVFP